MGSPVAALLWRDVVGQRWIRCAVWQGVISCVVWLILEFVLNRSWRSSYGNTVNAVVVFPFLWTGIRFLLFQASQLFFVLGQTFISDPEERDSASIGDLFGGLVKLFLSALAGRSREEIAGSDLCQLRNRMRTTLDYVWFVTMCVISGFLAFMSLLPSVQLSSGSPSTLEIGLRGAALGLLYAGLQFYLQCLSLPFPTVQRGLFFAFKMGIPRALTKSVKLALALLPLGESAGYVVPTHSGIGSGNRSFLWQQLLFGVAAFFVTFCWEISHYNIQVMQTKQYTFAPPLGSAAAETGPSDLLLMVLEDSETRALVQYHAFLDLCLISETNVETWRRSAIFEETGDTYARLIISCLKRLDSLTHRLVQCVEAQLDSKGLDLLKYEMQVPHAVNDLPNFQPGNSSSHFRDFQVCAWCARTVASLTSSSRFEDRYGVAQLHGCNIAVVSSLLSCLLVIEVYLGRRSSAHAVSFVPNSIKWTIPARGSFMEVGKKRGNPFGKQTIMHKKAYAMADVLRTSLYQIVAVFGDEMVLPESGGPGYGVVLRDWLRQKKPLYGTYEIHLQKLRMFLECRV